MSGMLGANHWDAAGSLKPIKRTASATVAPTERINLVTTAGGNLTFTLPPASSVPGAVFTFDLVVDGGTDMIVASPEASARISLTFADAGDRLAVWSNGLNWYILENVGGS